MLKYNIPWGWSSTNSSACLNMEVGVWSFLSWLPFTWVILLPLSSLNSPCPVVDAAQSMIFPWNADHARPSTFTSSWVSPCKPAKIHILSLCGDYTRPPARSLRLWRRVISLESKETECEWALPLNTCGPPISLPTPPTLLDALILYISVSKPCCNLIYGYIISIRFSNL